MLPVPADAGRLLAVSKASCSRPLPPESRVEVRVEVRTARPADAPDWERMRQRLWPSSPGEHAREIEAFFSGERRDPLEVFLARDDGGSAIGFAEASIRAYAEACDSGRVGYLEGLYVEPPHRRRGFAAALVRAVEEWARAQGCSELASDTAIDNEASAALHRASGFAEVAHIICFRKDL